MVYFPSDTWPLTVVKQINTWSSHLKSLTLCNELLCWERSSIWIWEGGGLSVRWTVRSWSSSLPAQISGSGPTVVHNPQFDKLFYKAGCYGSTKLAINNLQFINISFMQILILSLIKTSLTVWILRDIRWCLFVEYFLIRSVHLQDNKCSCKYQIWFY